MNRLTRALVWNRAKARCEYCQLRQKHQPFYRFQIEHITPRKHGGADFLANLALACPACNGCKGTNLTGIDPKSRKIVVLFDPRRNSWSRHFRWDGLILAGRTAVGRATIEVLGINRPDRISLRETLQIFSEWSPD